MKNEEKARLVVEEVKKAVVGKDNCVATGPAAFFGARLRPRTFLLSP